MSNWKNLRFDYRLTGVPIYGRQDYDAKRDQITTLPNRLVSGSVRRIGGNERPLFWASTPIPAYLGLLTTGNSILPAKVISNAPNTDGTSVNVKIAGEEHRFSVEQVNHFPDEDDPDTHRYIGKIGDFLTNTAGFPGSLALLHQVKVECVDPFESRTRPPFRSRSQERSKTFNMGDIDNPSAVEDLMDWINLRSQRG